MNQNSVECVFKEMFAAIDACLENKIKLPALLLAYTLIDIAGWLNSNEASVKARFTDWVEKYILPNSTLPCNSLELYGARCGLLHSYSATSELSSAGKVRKIFYVWQPSRVEDHSKLISLYEELMTRLGKTPEQIIAIQVEDIFAALKTGVEKFLSEIASDPQRAVQIYDKAGNIMLDYPDADMQELIAKAKNVLGKA